MATPADGTQMQAPPQADAPAAPVAAPTPDAPQQTQQTQQQPPPVDDGGLSEARSAMEDGDAGSFLANFLAHQGTSITPDPAPSGAPPAPAPAPAPVPPVGNGNPPPNTGLPPQPPQVDPAQLARLMAPAAPQPPAPVALPAWMQPAPAPQQPAMPPQQTQQPQQQQQTEQLPRPYTAPFPIPEQIAAALDHEDPRQRIAAIGAIVAASGNDVFEKVVQYVQEAIAPKVAQATFGQVQRQSFQQTMDRELYGNFPHLRYASPALIQQAAQVVVADETSRNPNAVVTEETWRKIGSLASAGLQQLSSGQVPQFTPPAQPPQPQPVWNGQQWVYATAPPPAPPPAPFIAGQTGMPMSNPTSFAPTPDSEVASFLRGEWG
jgi:hypothetical protein